MHSLQYGISSAFCIQEPHHRLGMISREDSSKKVANTTQDKMIIMSWIIDNEKCPQPCTR